MHSQLKKDLKMIVKSLMEFSLSAVKRDIQQNDTLHNNKTQRSV
jgi:hypothetical protein